MYKVSEKPAAVRSRDRSTTAPMDCRGQGQCRHLDSSRRRGRVETAPLLSGIFHHPRPQPGSPANHRSHPAARLLWPADQRHGHDRHDHGYPLGDGWLALLRFRPAVFRSWPHFLLHRSLANQSKSRALQRQSHGDHRHNIVCARARPAYRIGHGVRADQCFRQSLGQDALTLSNPRPDHLHSDCSSGGSNMG